MRWKFVYGVGVRRRVDQRRESELVEVDIGGGGKLVPTMHTGGRGLRKRRTERRKRRRRRG